MILFKKFLLMNFSAPCRQAGLYAFLAAMGTPEEEERPVKLTRFKKMSSTPELDKEDDGEECEVDSCSVSDTDEEVKFGEQGRDDEGDVDGPGSEMVEAHDNETSSSVSPVNDSGGGGGGVQEDRDARLTTATTTTTTTTCPEKTSAVGPCGGDTVDGRTQHTYKLLSEMMEASLVLRDPSSECGGVKNARSADGGVGGVCSESGGGGGGDGAKIVTDSECPADTEAGQRIPACHTTEEGAAEGVKEELEVRQVKSPGGVREELGRRREDQPEGARRELRPEGARRELRDIREEPSAECLSSDDQDSLHLSDVEDTHSSFTSSTSTTSSSPTTTSTSTQATSSSPLDLSDLLRVSEDVLAQSPGKTLNILQRHLEKGGSLLQEAAATGETEASVRELASALHLHLTHFTDRLHHTRDRLEDTARCYHLLDKAYEWALEAMKVVGRVKGEGLASPEQVGAAARTLTAHLEEHPPIPDHTFVAMTTLATRLNNHTLLQQCKMAQVRCQETSELLRTRQAALQKAKRQMEFDCQSYVDLGEVFGGGGGEEQLSSPLAWLACSPLNASGRRKSVSSVGSRPREPLSRCPSLDTDDDSVFLDTPPPPPPTKTPLEARTSLGGIKEVRESAEDLQQTSALSTPTTATLTSSAPPTTSSSSSSGTSGTSSCSSSDSSGPVTTTKKFMKRANTWQYGMMSKDHDNSGMDDGMPQSPTGQKNIPPSSAVNSHLLIRGSQLNLSFNTEDLSQEEVKKSKTLLLIMRELIQTERDYVNALEYIIENYIPELMREDIPQALRGQRNVVFGNIEKIYEFHSGYFLRALEACEMQPFTVGSIFLRYESQFYLYALYNKNKPKSDSLMSEYGSAFFRNKQLELGDKMDLASYLLKPVQRMGKYALILKQLLKECGRGEESHEDLQGAQEMVQFQLRHGNDLLAMDSLRDCDVNLKEQGRLLRQGEFVVWEGSRAKKSVRHVFLFEDLILFSKARRDPEKKTLDIFQYKHSMKMTDIGLTEQVGESITKFEIWFRKRKPSDTYLLQAPNAEMKESWTEEISKLLWRQALRNRTMRLHEMSSMGIGNKPCLDIRPSEDQISDRSISINQLHKAPRLRAGSICGVADNSTGGAKRPHSIISVSSSSASSSASSNSSSHCSAVCPTYVGSLNLGFEAGDSPRALHRSVTRTSQCSAESGILADMYSGGDDDTQSHRRVERSNSTVTTLSVDSALSPASSTSPTSPTSPFTSPTSSTSPTSPTSPFTSPTSPLTSVSSPRQPDIIYEAHVVPPTKDSSAKTLLTTEV